MSSRIAFQYRANVEKMDEVVDYIDDAIETSCADYDDGSELGRYGQLFVVARELLERERPSADEGSYQIMLSGKLHFYMSETQCGPEYDCDVELEWWHIEKQEPIDEIAGMVEFEVSDAG